MAAVARCPWPTAQSSSCRQELAACPQPQGSEGLGTWPGPGFPDPPAHVRATPAETGVRWGVWHFSRIWCQPLSGMFQPSWHERTEPGVSAQCTPNPRVRPASSSFPLFPRPRGPPLTLRGPSAGSHRPSRRVLRLLARHSAPPLLGRPTPESLHRSEAKRGAGGRQCRAGHLRRLGRGQAPLQSVRGSPVTKAFLLVLLREWPAPR